MSETASSAAVLPAATKPRHLPMYNVLLHNDDVNDMEYVVETIVMLTPLTELEANERMKEAHSGDCALLLVIHRERAELYVEQFHSRNLTVTIEPAE